MSDSQKVLLYYRTNDNKGVCHEVTVEPEVQVQVRSHCLQAYREVLEPAGVSEYHIALAIQGYLTAVQSLFQHTLRSQGLETEGLVALRAAIIDGPGKNYAFDFNEHSISSDMIERLEGVFMVTVPEHTY